jgi:hypothetical protein
MLDFLTAGTGQHIKVFDGRSGQGNESVKFVDASHHINHVLTGQGVFREEIPEPT